MTISKKQRRSDPPVSHAPVREGGSFFFEVAHRWEVRALLDDDAVRKVYSLAGLEDAFHDPSVRTILIPSGSAIARVVARRVCSRHGAGKTVFFEMAAA